MIQTRSSKEGKLSIIARMGVKYIPFELEESAQKWVRQQPSEDSITPVDLITMILESKAQIAPPSTHARFLKRITDEPQIPLQLDFTQSFLSCEETGQKSNLCLCLINHGKEYELKLLTETAACLLPVEKQIPISELSLDQLKEFIEIGNFSQNHPTVKRLKHWFAGRMELWGLAYG